MKLPFCYTVSTQLSAHFTKICYLTTFHGPTLNVTTRCQFNTWNDVTTVQKVKQNKAVVNTNDTTFIQKCYENWSIFE